MKKLIIAVLLTSCGINQLHNPDIIIESKSTSTCMCDFKTVGTEYNYGYFSDTCQKFKVGDTIKIVK